MFPGVGSSSLRPHSALAHSLAALNTVISPQLGVSSLIVVRSVSKSISVNTSDRSAISSSAQDPRKSCNFGNKRY